MKSFVLLFALLSFSAQALGVTVVGVIASERDERSIVLVRTSAGATKTFVVGESVEGMQIKRVTRDFVFFKIGERVEKVRVGESTDDAMTDAAPVVAGFSSSGFEKKGNQVVMSTALREHLVQKELGKILMQAAAVPHYEGGELRGFRFWEIDKGSVFDRVGLQDGDVVTVVNGQVLSDVGRTIQLLNTLKQASRADITVVRQGVEQSIEIVVQ